MPARYSAVSFDEGELLDFLRKRFGKLQGVCITGGEPTIQKDLLEFIEKLKTIGYKVKLDTNGTNPKRLKRLVEANKIDYIAMDIKVTLKKYPIATNSVDLELYLDGKPLRSDYPQLSSNIKDSIEIIMNSGIDYEFRTTVCHPVHEVVDFEEIGKLIKGAKRYFIQNFVQSKHNNEKIKFTPFTDGELNKSREIIEEYVELVGIR